MRNPKKLSKKIALVIATGFVSLSGFFIYQHYFAADKEMVSIHFKGQRGCSEPSTLDLRALITTKAQRFDHFTKDGKNARSIVTDISKGDSWSLDHLKKKANLLQDPSQLGATAQKKEIPLWALVSEKSESCLGDRECKRFEFEGESGQLTLKTLKLKSAEKVWLKSQRRDMKDDRELGLLLEKYADDQALVAFERSKNCESLTVEEVKVSVPDAALFAVPSDYQKNFYTDLQKLAPEVREAILKRENVQILEANPHAGATTVKKEESL